MAQQRAVLAEAFRAFYLIGTPGEIIDVPFQWKRHRYSGTEPETLKNLEP